MLTSATWSSADDLSIVFAVSPGTLELYRQRGTLASYVDARGRRLYDGAAVGAIFRRRGAPAVQTLAGSFGRLGEVTLGEASAGPVDGEAWRPRRAPTP
jgi:hypothetical protein